MRSEHGTSSRYHPGVADGIGRHYIGFFDFSAYAESVSVTMFETASTGMRFNLVDRIVAVERGRIIQAAKNLSLGEEYLADHFPGFPVMPGVLMLQTLVEAGAWLLRVTDDFQHSVVVLQEAKNVKFGNFMEPGRQMVVTAELVEQNGSSATFRGKGEVGGQPTVSARLTLLSYNLRDRDAALASVDEQIIAHLRRQYAVIGGDAPRQQTSMAAS